MGISGWFGLEAIAYSLNYTIIMDSCQLSEIEAVFSFLPVPRAKQLQRNSEFRSGKWASGYRFTKEALIQRAINRPRSHELVS